MLLSHAWGLFTHPDSEWDEIRRERTTVSSFYVGYIMLMAAVPPVCGLIGSTLIGWQFGDGAAVRLTLASALPISILFYLAILAGIYVIGRTIHWMAKNFDADIDLPHSIAFAAYTATPMLLCGLMGLYPIIWLNMLVGLLALAYTVYLLYEGMPILARIPKEKAFLLSSSVLTVGMVTLVGVMAVTVILWGSGLAPRFTLAG